MPSYKGQKYKKQSQFYWYTPYKFTARQVILGPDKHREDCKKIQGKNIIDITRHSIRQYLPACKICCSWKPKAKPVYKKKNTKLAKAQREGKKRRAEEAQLQALQAQMKVYAPISRVYRRGPDGQLTFTDYERN